VTLASSPTVPQRGAASSGLRLLVLAVGLGAIAGGAVAYFRAVRRPSFNHPHDPELVLHAPLIVELPNGGPAGSASRGPWPDRWANLSPEVFGIAAALVEGRRASKTTRSAKPVRGESLAVISAMHAEGRTTVAANVAIALASRGARTLLIDADESGDLTEALLEGWADSLPCVSPGEGPPPLEGFRSISLRTGAGEGGVASADRGNEALELSRMSGGLISPTRTAALLRALEEYFEFVVIDTPPFLGSAQAASLAEAAGDVLVVVDENAAIGAFVEVARRLEVLNATSVGYIYNHKPSSHRGRWSAWSAWSASGVRHFDFTRPTPRTREASELQL
jgi:Mrp family chromosome partitioning ATPase